MIRRRTPPPADQHLSPSNVRQVLVSLALVVAPHALHVHPWIILLAAACGLWRWLAAQRSWRPPATAVRSALVVAGLAGVLLTAGGVSGQEAGVSLLIVMLSFKLIEARGHRDAMILMLLAYFVIATNFLYSQAIPLTLYLFAAAVAVTANLVAVGQPGPTPSLRRRLATAGRLLGQAVPLALVMFLLFPRIPGPLWGLPSGEKTGRMGLDDTMSPGSISRLGRSDAVAFRVSFDGEAPPNPELYWRGPVLWLFNGRAWRPGSTTDRSPPTLAPAAEAVSYTVTLEPHGGRWLLALDMPATTPFEARITGDRQMLAQDDVEQRTRYRAVSYTAYRLGSALDPEARRRALQLPPYEANPRTRALGRRWAEAGLAPERIVSQALTRFRKQDYVYTLEPAPLSEAPMDSFLFRTREGFCEHYAGAFVLLMRAAGVPARVVTGYQGGERNPLGDYFIVRQSDAHAWAEVWLDGRGWVRIDPTAAVSPDRVERGMAAAVRADDAVPYLAVRGDRWLRRLRLGWDAVNRYWNAWVLAYGPANQLRTLKALGLAGIGQTGMVAVLAGVVAGLLGALSLVLLWQGRPPAPDPLARIYARFCRRLASLGATRRPHEGPRDFARRAAAARPDLALRIERITEVYVAARYGARPDPAALETLRREIRRLPGPGAGYAMLRPRRARARGWRGN